jgi:hypothetical protein
MKSTFACTTVLGFIVLIQSCQPVNGQESSQVAIDTAAIKASIDSLGAVVSKAHYLRDSKMFASTWAKDGILSMPGSPPVYGRDAIASSFANTPPLPPGSNFQMRRIDMKIMAADWVYILGTDSLTYTPVGASLPIKEASTFFVIIRKTPEGWQTFREVLSPNQSQKERK